MGNKFASGKHAIAECDVCGFQYKLNRLRPLVNNHKHTNVLACPECWEDEHPQNDLGRFPVEDAQAIRNPRPDKAQAISRMLFDALAQPNSLPATARLGTVVVVIS